MAVEQFPGSQLVLFGFDSTTPDKPRFYSCFASESEKERTRHHDFLKEKQLIRRLTAAEWLGEPANNRLEWVDAPLLPDMAGMR